MGIRIDGSASWRIFLLTNFVTYIAFAEQNFMARARRNFLHNGEGIT